MANVFQVAFTADFYNDAGALKYRDVGLDALAEHPHVHYRALGQYRAELAAEQLGSANGVISLAPAVTRDTVARADDLLAIGRFGMYDGEFDVEACIEADVVAFHATDALDRPLAETVVGWMLSLAHRLRQNDRLAREGAADDAVLGAELRGRTLAIAGVNGASRTLLELLAAWGMKQPLAYDPQLDSAEAERLGVKLVEFDDLFREGDFISIHLPDNAENRGVVDKRSLALMKHDAYLINIGGGDVVDEDALHEALTIERIGGAAIGGVAAGQPHRLAEFDTALLGTPTASWTQEMHRDMGRTLCEAMVQLSLGKRPPGALNPEVFDRPSFQEKWERICGAS